MAEESKKSKESMETKESKESKESKERSNRQFIVIGSDIFTLGFQLAGVTRTIIAQEKGLLDQLMEPKQDPIVGIVVVEQGYYDTLDSHGRYQFESSVSPIFFALSEEKRQDTLRMMIKKSIGVDLMKEG